MLNTLITIAIAFISGYGAFHLSTGKAVDNRSKGFKKVTKTGRGYLILTAILLLLVFLQSSIENKEQEVYEERQKSRYDSTILVMKNSYDSTMLAMTGVYDTNSKATIAVVSDVLGKYGFKFDSTNKKLITLVRDSAKTKIIETLPPLLTLSVQKNLNAIDFRKITDTSFNFKLNFMSHYGTSTSFKIDAFLFTLNPKYELEYLFPILEALPSNYKLGHNVVFPCSFGISGVKESSTYYFWIIGTYEDLRGNKPPIDVNIIYSYDVKLKQHTVPINPKQRYLLSILPRELTKKYELILERTKF